MKTLSYHHFIFLLAGLLFASAVNAQIAYMHGSTYEERSHSLIDQMLQTQPVANGNLKSATKPFNVLIACARPLITELSDKLRLKHPLLPTISPYPTMRLETIRCILFKSLKEPLLEILLIAYNLLIINANYEDKMAKETN